MQSRFWRAVIIVASIFLFFFVYPQGWNKSADFLNTKLHLASKKYKIPHFFSVRSFRLGLDLVGGTHLVYEADLKNIGDQKSSDAMNGIRDVIERRVNLFGVSEPVVQVEGKNRLVVELAGVNDVNQAIQMIGQTPFLEFKEELPATDGDAIIKAAMGKDAGQITAANLCAPQNIVALTAFLQQYLKDPCYKSTGLTGSQLKSSQLIFEQTTGRAEVSLTLTGDGGKLFADITKRDLNKRVAIYLDGAPISVPTVQSEITDGKAVISGTFTPQEAKDLAGRLNAGALPVPINLISQQTVGASLGKASLDRSLVAGLWGFVLVGVFMILYYRLPGVMAVFALLIYTIFVLSIYKIIPVTLTLAGIAGFILSLGMAVDANVLIFARMREELRAGKQLNGALTDGFSRAWYSIRDSHVTTLLGASILYILTTSIVKGFALTLGIGVLMSLFSSIIVTRSFMRAIVGPFLQKHHWLL